MGGVAERRQGRGLAVGASLGLAAAAWAVALALALALSVVVAVDGHPLAGDLRLTHWAQDLPAFHSVARGFRGGVGTEGVLLLGIAVAVGLYAS